MRPSTRTLWLFLNGLLILSIAIGLLLGTDGWGGAIRSLLYMVVGVIAGELWRRR